MFDENGTWYCLFSPTLEEYIVYKTSGKDLTIEEIEALDMWVYKQHGIMPNQYHHFYDDGNTLIYPEHIHDLITIDQMYVNRLEKERREKESKTQNKTGGKNNTIGTNGNPASQFYGRQFVYKK